VPEAPHILCARWRGAPRDRIARMHPSLPPEPPGDDYVLFASNFDGSWDQYIDGFGTIPRIKRGLRWIWFLSRGFPGPWPLGQFKRYIRHFEVPADFYYCAYGDASVKDIQRALQLDHRLENFLLEQTDILDEAEFELRYRSFMHDVTPHLSVAAVASEPASGNSLPGEDSDR
jgi:hypothetical protein